jgi:hypothetical protein
MDNVATRRYPAVRIRSKRELAKHISTYNLSPDQARDLISDCIDHFDDYWKDHPKESKPEKGKWVRDCSYSNLGKLLKRINNRVLKPNDHLIPGFIFGGVSGLDHKAAVQHLLGHRRNRMILKLDITKFFEQIQYDRVYNLFLNKFECSKRGAKIFADLCCVNYGAKESPEDYKTIARGFSTSPRLAIWCNLDTFMRIDRLVRKELAGKDPRIAIYVDDIGITASKVTVDDMVRVYEKVLNTLEYSDQNQRLPLNHNKTKIINHDGNTFDIRGNLIGKWGFEHLGLQMNRNSVSPGSKTRWKLTNITDKYKRSRKTNGKLRKRRKSILKYKNYVEKDT